MKRIFFILFFWFLVGSLFAVKIEDIFIRGNSDSNSRTILFYFFEYDPDKDYTPGELERALQNWARRLERTGWFRNIYVTNEYTPENTVRISLELTESFFYTAQLFDRAVGFGKQNIWGKGKEIFFEVGTFQKKITLIDHMYNFSPFFYQVSLGTTEEDLVEYRGDFYQTFLTLRQKGEALVGWHVFPDHIMWVSLGGQSIVQTNQMPLERGGYLSLSYLVDTRRGYPSFSSGWHWQNDARWFFLSGGISWETTASWHTPLGKTWQLGLKWHHGLTYGKLQSSEKYLLRQINGLHTLSQSPGLLGDNCWDVHGEIRWKFWEVIPFVIFDMQLEAVAFLEGGEAWTEWRETPCDNYPFWTDGISFALQMRTYSLDG
ncbi:BamA/TamA family outer membrane protein [Thermospira aquatica]|uniref:POTRA domain-containing protein n=1 Tax=Thermospira aquatica TaxID=2828656 RepID=A0AAX3BG74_9SPIR|nr:hypothetical protein [Thermospira aquatica]URA11280.1 hypothetical protein KDW03_05650 [Thermospira aquatica]